MSNVFQDISDAPASVANENKMAAIDFLFIFSLFSANITFWGTVKVLQYVGAHLFEDKVAVFSHDLEFDIEGDGVGIHFVQRSEVVLDHVGVLVQDIDFAAVEDCRIGTE